MYAVYTRTVEFMLTDKSVPAQLQEIHFSKYAGDEKKNYSVTIKPKSI